MRDSPRAQIFFVGGVWAPQFSVEFSFFKKKREKNQRKKLLIYLLEKSKALLEILK